MALVVVENGLLLFGLDWATKANAEEYLIGTFQNDWTPAIGDDISDVVESSYSGYAGALALSAWDTGGISIVANKARITHPTITWTATAVDLQDIYGYFVKSSSDVLLWAERRIVVPIPFVMGQFNGQVYTVDPVMNVGFAA